MDATDYSQDISLALNLIIHFPPMIFHIQAILINLILRFNSIAVIDEGISSHKLAGS